MEFLQDLNWTNVLLGAIFLQQGIFHAIKLRRCGCERCMKKRHH